MTELLRLRGIQHALGGRTLFAGLDFSVGDGERVALVGHNGCGKSTLLDVLAGDLQVDEGEVTRRRGLQSARVEQFLPDALATVSLTEAVARVAGGEAWRAQAMLSRLGFAEAQMTLPVEALSGGQQNRLMFARALVQEPQLLLLDEPTNHLDLETIVQFEDVLKNADCAFVLVSHDRAFLDAVTNRTAFIADGRIRRFELSYSAAKSALDAQDDAARRTRAAEEKKIAKLEESAKQLTAWARAHESEKLARRAKSMERRIERLESEKTQVSAKSPLHLDLALAGSRAKQALAVQSLEVRVADRTLFAVDDLIIRPGERVALVGGNGVGKTTFIKHLIGRVGTEDAQVRFNPQTTLGYYDQELDETASAERMQDFVRARVDVAEQRLRQQLIGAGFRYADHDKKMNELSGGERARVLFQVLSMRGPNFLVLDEPTNHIDIQGKEELEASLLASDATLIVTSHDRAFLDSVTDRFLWIRDGRLHEADDLRAFYASMSAGETAEETSTEAAPANDVFARLEALEALLAADLARKKKFQKPALQAQWQAEIDALYAQMEELE